MSPSTSSILRYINRNILENSQNMDEPKEKKRRLNHLTWEEKVQRKKLKNRVAAQTSRDRKKLRMEQLETAVQELYAHNERLEADCTRLRDENAQLLLLTTSAGTITCRNCCTTNRTPKTEPLDPATNDMSSAVSPPRLPSSEQITCESGPAAGSSVPTDDSIDGDGDALLADLSLPELLELGLGAQPQNQHLHQLQQLDQLAESLLRDLAEQLAAPEQAADTDMLHKQSVDLCHRLVGTTPEQLESTGPARINSPTSSTHSSSGSIEEEISPYLLLHHHNYSKTKKERPLLSKSKSARKLKRIRPKQSVLNNSVIRVTVNAPVQTVFSADIAEIETRSPYDTLGQLMVPSPPNSLASSPLSPMSVSDHGYDSLATFSESDCDNIDPIDHLDDIWNDSVSELFPMLI